MILIQCLRYKTPWIFFSSVCGHHNDICEEEMVGDGLFPLVRFVFGFFGIRFCPNRERIIVETERERERERERQRE